MPCKEVTEMKEKIRFVSLLKTNRHTLTGFCEQFGVSRRAEDKAHVVEPVSFRGSTCFGQEVRKDVLRKHLAAQHRGGPQAEILPLFARLSQAEQEAVFNPASSAHDQS